MITFIDIQLVNWIDPNDPFAICVNVINSPEKAIHS